MYCIYLFKLPYSRDIHTHFTSKGAEDFYLKSYMLDGTPITYNKTLNPRAKSFRVDLQKFVKPKDITYAIIVDNSNGEFYYYYVTDFAVLSPFTVELFVEMDIYHTYFNNRGNYIEFSGYLLQSNTLASVSDVGTARRPTGEPFKCESYQDFFEDNSKYSLIVFLSLSKSGAITLVYNEMGLTSPTDYDHIIEVLTAGKATMRVIGTTSTREETYSIISAYIVPARLVGYNSETGNRQYTITYDNHDYVFFVAGGTEVKLNYFPFGRYVNAVGTPFNRLNLDNKNPSEIKISLNVKSGNPSILINVDNTRFLNIVEDFSVSVNYSQEAQFYAQNRVSLGINGISAGINAGKLFGGDISALSELSNTLLSSINDCYKAAQQPLTNVISGNYSVYTTYNIYGGSGVFLQQFSSRNQDNLYNSYQIYGGNMDNTLIEFSAALLTDKKLPTRFYKFSLFDKTENAVFSRVEQMFKDGIFIKFWEKEE